MPLFLKLLPRIGTHGIPRQVQGAWHSVIRHSSDVLYEQGQSPEPKIREYFYYIDHQGMLFLDDAKMKNFTSCLKEKKFLRFFFRQIHHNKTGRYMDSFPWLSPCGLERNFIRCDDTPIVYTHLIKRDSWYDFGYAHAGEYLVTPFEPDRVCMLPQTGRIYHPAAEKVGGVGLIRSGLAIEFSTHFKFENGDQNPPTHFTWDGKTYELKNDLVDILMQDPNRLEKHG
ncbi:unnamed protein product [Darwinula stevensoni]|uniref:Uncharacterized protein n=1 Tax=Darwinula stevensoni TaxID=69355 RepID=A0A7R8XDP9_9CRUS|nr:unnamed protein product [Darwinula stevensoni]CAG0887044.1 unnamed protein product [Darwinula stevensoni]